MAYFSDDGDDSWLDNLTLEDVFGISQETTGLGEKYFGTGKDISAGETMGPMLPPGQEDLSAYQSSGKDISAGETMGPMLPPGQEDLSAYQSSGDNAIGGRTSGRGSASPGGMSSGPDDGGSIFDGLKTFIRDNPNLIGLGATVGSMWLKTISDNRNASQEDDANWWKRANAEQEKKDAITRAGEKSDTDWEREKERIKLGQDFTTATNAQTHKNQLELIAAQNAGRSSGGGGGGGGFDPAAAKAARISASLVGQKAPTTGIVNSNIWGNALNTLQKR